MTKIPFYALVAMLLVLIAPARAAAWDIDQLMQTLAKIRQGRATFVEKKYIAVLEKPVESSGELFFSAPDRLERKTLKPKPETMLLEGGVLTIERGGRKHVLQLQDYPELASFIDSIRGTLAGDRKALERTFKLQLEGDAERWILSLTPSDVRMVQRVQLIRIGGARDSVRSVDILQADGDRSAMSIERVSAQ